MYNKEFNKPGDKFGFDVSQTLTNADPFINLSLKITYDGKSHYLTLANISKNGNSNFEFGEKTGKAYTDKIKELTEYFKANPETSIVEVGKPLTFTDVKLITNTRLVKFKDSNGKNINSKTYLDEITNTFPGTLVKSEGGVPTIFFYPSEPNYEAFKSLINSFSYGTPRTEEQIKKLYEKYAGKPYIKLSYKNDFEGGVGKDIQTKLIPVFVESRTIEQVKQEAKEIYGDGNQSFDKKAFNALASPTQILDWLTKLIIEDKDLFDRLFDTEKGEFNKSSVNFKLPTSILGLIEDIFTSRDTKKVGSSFINFKTTLETIAKTYSDNSTLSAEELKKKVLPLIKTNGTWAMPFINLFNPRFYKNPSEEYKPIIAEMQETVDKLMAFIGNQGPIYYNILSYNDNNNTVRKTSDGTNISKKTFINAVPEPPRIIINLESKFKEELVNPEKPIVSPKANVENVTTATVDPTKDKIIFTNPNIKLDGFNIDGNYYNIITTAARPRTLVSINGVVIPFYITTGLGGKNLTPGWYPYFGTGQDGWLNKTHGNDMATYYSKY